MTSRFWVEPFPGDRPQSDLLALVGGSDLLARVLIRRGISTIEQATPFLDPNQSKSISSYDFPGMEKAVAMISGAIRNQKHILVWGDFDVDGQTSTTILVQTLRTLGGKVSYHIPVRETESHGISRNILEDWINQGIDLLLTCDTGISAVGPIGYAKSMGIEVVLTDHHDLPEKLPPADCIISPHLLPVHHPSSTLPGVGVAFKLAQALLTIYHREEIIPDLLDLVALGIVADVAQLTGEARTLLQLGLISLRTTHRLGLQMLYNLTDLNPDHLTEDHIGFILAPRMNAVGRLADANPMVDFLTSTDQVSVRIFASQLESLNLQRKLLCDQIYQAAENQILSDRSLMEDGILVLTHSGWHAGVIGIVASHLTEKYNRPAILISSPDGNPARGSARSIEGIDITAAIASQKELLLGYGGHAMAAGLSLPAESIPAFRLGINQYITKIGPPPSQAILAIDSECELFSLSLSLAHQVDQLSPFGAGNPPLVFLSRNLVRSATKHVGKNGDHLLITVQDNHGNEQTVIWWQADEDSLPEGPMDLAFTLHASNFRGQETIQLEYIDSRPAQSDLGITPQTIVKEPTILDFRATPLPSISLKKVHKEYSDLLIWAEGIDPMEISTVNRDRISHTSTLVIWTAPPDWLTWQMALHAAQPDTIVLFCTDAGLDNPQALITRLGGMAKYVIRHFDGNSAIPQLAASTGHRIQTVEMGLRWMAHSGILKVNWLPDGQVHLSVPDRPLRGDVAAVYKSFSDLVNETRAFRQFFRRVPKATLLSKHF